MPISESKNRANRAWDRDNMRTVSCRVRTEDAIEFSEYCKENNTKPGAILKDFVYGIFYSITNLVMFLHFHFVRRLL